MTTVRELTNRHRAQQLLLRDDTSNSVAKLWSLIDWSDLDGSYPDLASQAAVLVNRNRQNSNGLASLYLKQARRAAGLPGSQRVIFSEPMPPEQLAASLETTSIVALKTSSKNGVAADVALTNALTRTQGAMSRLVLNAGRRTIARTTSADPRITGWQRVGVGKCDLCSLLLGRGAVYREETVSFEAHDNCGCSGEPVYS